MNRLLCLLLLLPAMCVSQATSGFHRVSQVVTRSNSGTYAAVVPGATVYVTNTTTGLAATIYSDPGLTVTVPGSIITTDFYGNYGYYLPLSTCVTENISSPSQGSLTIPNICGNAGVSLPISPSSGGTGTTTNPTSGQILIGQAGPVYAPETMIQDCTLVANGTITCLKTNGVSFTTAATTAIGTSGAVIPLLSTANAWSQNQTFSGSSTTSTILGIGNTTSKNWQWIVRGSATGTPGTLDLVDFTDSTTVLSFSNSTGKLFGSPICTTANAACSAGSGTVTSFAAPTAGWPTWLVPAVATSTTTPSLTVSASAIPNSALQNTVITVNSVPCTLGSSCSVSGSSRTCNANGCYIIYPDGTLEEWGTDTTGCGSSLVSCFLGIVFPRPFTTTSNLTIVVTSSVGPTNWAASAQSASTTGFNLAYGALMYTNSVGDQLDGSERSTWFAIGH